MKKHSKLTFASMLTAAGAMICLANCVNTPATGEYGPPGMYEHTNGDESQEFSEVRFLEEKIDEEESFYRVEADLPATDFSVISESLSDMIEQEWNRWDNMTSLIRIFISLGT